MAFSVIFVSETKIKFKNHGIATLLGGANVPATTVASALTLAPRLFCADGGANTAVSMGLDPISVIGDLDSITQETQEQLTCPVHHDHDQNSTDFEKILGHVTEDILICLGFLGQRLDHSLAAMTALTKFPKKRAILVGEEDICFLAPPTISFDARAGDRVSLYPISESRARSRGLRWPLDTHAFHPERQTATSNEAKGGQVELYDIQGSMLIILPGHFLEPVVSELINTQAG